MSDQAALTELFDRAREADIEAVAGVKLYRVGRRMRGECPLCGASQGKKAGGAFSVDPHGRMFKCWACLAGGDVIKLEQLLAGGSARDAAERLVGPLIARSPPRAAEPKVAPAGLSASERIAGELWGEASRLPISATPGAAYLIGRGIAPELVEALGPAMRFHPWARWGWDEDRGDWLRAPALIARVMTQAGPTGGIHATYLAADCRAKANLNPAKRMWGRQSDGQGRPGGTWLTKPSASLGPVIVAEGIESALSAAQLHGGPCRIAAALSLGRLQGGWLLDRFGRLDPLAVAPDPEKPAFTWPDVAEVIVAVDRDMSPIEIKTRKLGGGTMRRRLSGDERARICAGLAVQAWRRAGAKAARTIAPAAGRDFNDELKARLAAGVA